MCGSQHFEDNFGRNIAVKIYSKLSYNLGVYENITDYLYEIKKSIQIKIFTSN